MSADVLAQLALFSFLDPQQIDTLSQHARAEVLPEEQMLFHEGDVGEEVYVVVDGLVRIHHTVGADTERTLAELGPGAMFGEAAIIDQDVRSASASAVTDTRLLVLDAGLLREFMLAHPAEGLLIMGRLGAMMMERLRRTNDRLKESMARDPQASAATSSSLHALASSDSPVDLYLRDQRHVRGRLVRVDADDGEDKRESEADRIQGAWRLFRIAVPAGETVPEFL